MQLVHPESDKSILQMIKYSYHTLILSKNNVVSSESAKINILYRWDTSYLSFPYTRETMV